MKLTIDGTPEEMADLVSLLQGQPRVVGAVDIEVDMAGMKPTGVPARGSLAK